RREKSTPNTWSCAQPREMNGQITVRKTRGPSIGPKADLYRDDNEERTVQAIAGFFSLPELETP
ncbi:hypothetical protein AB0N09_40395, partial [Streptomyces erythrochromogenes]|uniref:hypothetical protein n=1 Tax=Streptomyces erythrochromogenes TaxID=285574 RepID=UPI003427FD6F